MVAAIAPGPAKSGVPSGTSATLTSSVASASGVPLPVSRSSATNSNSNPPAPCNAGMPMPRYARMNWPATANSVITNSETSTA